MSDLRISISYDGDAIEEGLMDVQELAPALLSFGNLYQEANNILNGENVKVAVKVKSDFRKGSFLVDFEVFHTIKQIFFLAPVVSAHDIATFLGFLKSGVGLLDILKQLKGRKPESSTTLENGNIQINIKGNNNLVVSQNVGALLNNGKILKSTYGIVKPLERPGIEKLEISESSTSDKKIIKREEISFFRTEDLLLLLQPQNEESLPISEREAFYEIVKLSFKEENVWGLMDGSGGTINASIHDEDFWDKVERHEITFGKGDQLHVRIQTQDMRTKDGKIQTKHTIFKVIEIIPPQTKQTSLLT